MREDIDWRILKGLYTLYIKKKTRNKLLKNDYVKNILFERRRIIGYSKTSLDILETRRGYKEYFETHFLEQYNYYSKFFKNAGIDNSALKQYDAYDLKTLMFIFNNSKELSSNLTTARIFSSVVFKQKDSKYLESKSGLFKDVLKLLKIDKFPDESTDNQWRISQDCENPIAILLCENFDFIKAYWEFTNNNIELWYVGGSNTAKLERISKRYLELPLYYVCDWDYHGLQIYERVVDIFEKKQKEITLITPKNPMLKPIKSGNHKSKWREGKFSNLERELYLKEQQILIEKLINTNTWVEEQTINPVELILNEIGKDE